MNFLSHKKGRTMGTRPSPHTINSAYCRRGKSPQGKRSIDSHDVSLSAVFRNTLWIHNIPWRGRLTQRAASSRQQKWLTHYILYPLLLLLLRGERFRSLSAASCSGSGSKGSRRWRQRRQAGFVVGGSGRRAALLREKEPRSRRGLSQSV